MADCLDVYSTGTPKMSPQGLVITSERPELIGPLRARPGRRRLPPDCLRGKSGFGATSARAVAADLARGMRIFADCVRGEERSPTLNLRVGPRGIGSGHWASWSEFSAMQSEVHLQPVEASALIDASTLRP